MPSLVFQYIIVLTHPSNRCITFGVTCDGYDIVAASSESRQKAPRPLLPLQGKPKIKAIPTARPVPGRQNKGPAIPASQSTIIYKQPNSTRFENDWEARYFESFSSEISMHMGGCFDPGLWPRAFLQASEAMPSMRKGLIALGALDLTSEAGLSRIREGPKKENTTDGFLFALQQYTHFIKGLKAVLNPDDVRTQLLASVLIICFESYLGDAKTAEFQVRTSVRLLNQWKQKHTKPWTQPLQSPAPTVVEDELIHLFERLDLELSQGDTMTQEEHIVRKDMGLEFINNMPPRFETITQARMYGTVMHRRTIHFLNAYDNRESSDSSIWDRVAGIATPGILAELQIHKDDFNRWAEAFDPIFKRSLTPEGVNEFRTAAIMRAHFLVLSLTMESVFQQNEMFYDYYHNDFVEMMALSKALVIGNESNFTLSAHSIIVLDLIVKKCRDYDMRREAIRLLVERPRREGFWDSVMAAHICFWILSIEEEGMVDGVIPEEARVRKIGASFDMVKKKANLWCYQPMGKGDLVELRKREKTIPLGPQYLETPSVPGLTLNLTTMPAQTAPHSRFPDEFHFGATGPSEYQLSHPPISHI
jgi:hypothetical protein